MDLKLEDDKLISPSDRFTLNNLDPSVKYIITGMSYSIVESAYRLKLDEWKDDDGWVFSDLDSSLMIDPSTIYLGTGNDYTSIDVFSKLEWTSDVQYLTGDSFWIGRQTTGGPGRGVWDELPLNIFPVTQTSSARVIISTTDASAECMIYRGTLPSAPTVTLSKSSMQKGGTSWCGGAGSNKFDVSAGPSTTWSVGITKLPTWDEFDFDVSTFLGTGNYTDYYVDFVEAYPGYTRQVTLTFYDNAVPQSKIDIYHIGGCV